MDEKMAGMKAMSEAMDEMIGKMRDMRKKMDMMSGVDKMDGAETIDELDNATKEMGVKD